MAVGYRIGIDVGGTFTDLVCADDVGRAYVLKVPTTRADPGIGVQQAVAALLAERGISGAQIRQFAHGTTVATNAVLERKGGRVGLLATAGFEDVLEIGRSFRTNMYNLAATRTTPDFLAPGARRRGVVERVAAD